MSEQEANIQTNVPKSIWGPGQVAVICVIFSFLAAGIMNAISHGRLGNEDKKVKTIWGIIIVFIVLITAGYFTPASYGPVFTGFHAGTVIYFYNDQKKLFEEFQSRSGTKKAGIWIPILSSIAVWIALFILLSFFILFFNLYVCIEVKQLFNIFSIHVLFEVTHSMWLDSCRNVYRYLFQICLLIIT